jgi:hypothetical protein
MKNKIILLPNNKIKIENVNKDRTETEESL